MLDWSNPLCCVWVGEAVGDVVNVVGEAGGVLVAEEEVKILVIVYRTLT